MRKIILYISSTLDGFIAKPNNDLSFLEKMHIEGEDYGYADFTSKIDTVIIGSKTYQWVIDQGFEYPQANKKVYVITRTEKSANGNITFYNGNVETLIKDLKSKPGKDIYCDGGAQLVNLLWQKGLIDEIILSVIPIVVGAGTKLFGQNIQEKELKLLNNKGFSSGLVQLHYAVMT